MQKVQLLIGAATSGSGKTTFTIGLLRALKNRGIKVQPFKCGPDYIDTHHHASASGADSVNLDNYMSSASHVKEVYARYAQGADACVIEGVMGLFDGYDKMKGSSAEIAALLHVPVILVINARSAAYSIAPLLYGFKNFYPGIQVLGVVFNFVSSAVHYRYLQQACEDVGVEALGYIPWEEMLEIPSRHLGLTLDNTFDFEGFAEHAAAVVNRFVCIDRLLLRCQTTIDEPLVTPIEKREALTIAVAKDQVFNFIYRENLAAMERFGKVIFFSPLQERTLPDADVLYFPGGYPELYLRELASNVDMLQAVRAFGEAGGRILAECGGMMYLCREIRDSKGQTFPMVGLLSQVSTMEKMRLKLGYRRVVMNGEWFYGHEFHYSCVLSGNEPVKTMGKVFNAKGVLADTLIYHVQHILATYVHFYWAERGFDVLLRQI